MRTLLMKWLWLASLMAILAGVIAVRMHVQPEPTWRRHERLSASQSRQLAGSRDPATPQVAATSPPFSLQLKKIYWPPGEYTPPGETAVYFPSFSRANVGDFTGDFLADVAVIGSASAEDAKPHVRVYAQNADGTWSLPLKYPIPGQYDPVHATALLDLNDDRREDLLIFKRESMDTLISSAGQPGHVMSTLDSAFPGMGAEPFAVAVDVDHDGRKDVVTHFRQRFSGPTVETRSRLAVFRNTGRGAVELGYTRFTSDESIHSGAEVHAITHGDFNSDGHVDLALRLVEYVYREQIRKNSVRILHGDGRGGFDEGYVVSNDFRLTYLAAGDFDGDGRDDLASVNASPLPLENKLYVFRQSANRLQQLPDEYLNYLGAIALKATDLDRDGDLDLIVGQEGHLRLTYYLQAGGKFSAQTYVQLGNHPSQYMTMDAFGFGRLDGDACNDVVAALGIGGIWLYRGQNCLPPAVADESGSRLRLE